MASNSPPDATAGVAAVSTPVAAIAQSTMFADQSRSRLMTLPKELRNKIYEFVFCDNLSYAHEVIANQWSLGPSHSTPDSVSSPTFTTETWKFNTELAHVPCLVRLDETSPPSKQPTLPCRQIHSEMKQMYIAAYRSYWTANRFLYIDAEMSKPARLPAEKNMQRIREFHLAVSSEYNLRVVLEDSKWTTWLLAADGGDLSFHTAQQWTDAHRRAQDVVTRELASKGPTRDPRSGRGLTRRKVAALSRLHMIYIVVRLLEVARRALERE